ncbi:glycosyltransferase family 2 protein [Actinomyces faecalis]|uniref:glycosyltransferase family 2 protein n=1 Tax=Actinomyces faecalis TaxID=2722820 RepID=UPI00155480B0|nr:glycosyltransferase family 2 protein [Actinomyces faecalis]
MSNEMQISIIIPFYGDPTPVLELINLIQDDVGEVAEIIVSDDCSPRPFPQVRGVRVVRRQKNSGFAAAVNAGVKEAKGDLLLVLNSDIEIDPGFIKRLVGAATPWLPAVVSVPVLTKDGAQSWSGRKFPRTSHYVVEWLLPLVRMRHHRWLHEAVGHDTMADGSRDEVVDWAMGALLLIPTSVFRSVQGLDEGFYMYCEEVDFQRRLRRIGIPSVILKDLFVTHEGGGSSPSQRRRGWLLDGRRRYERKWRGALGLKRFERLMLGASVINFGWNTARFIVGSRVDPLETWREQRELILRPEQWVDPSNRADVPQ